MGAIQKWAMKSRVEEKRERKAEEAKSLAEAVAHVRKREGNHCRACGRRCSPTATSMLEHGDVHHITYRSKGGDHDTRNLALLCRQCHANIHAGKMLIEGDADAQITVWRRDVDGGWLQVVRETPTGVERD